MAPHLLAVSVNRFARHPEFTTATAEGPRLQARRRDLDHLAVCTRGVQLATVLDPTATADEEHGHQCRRGLRASALSSAPETKSASRAALMPKAFALSRQNESCRTIAAELGVPYRTVANWLRRGAGALFHHKDG